MNKENKGENKEQFIHVPYGKAVWGDAEREAVMHVLNTSTQMGKHVREMEARVAALFDKNLELWSTQVHLQIIWRLKSLIYLKVQRL